MSEEKMPDKLAQKLFKKCPKCGSTALAWDHDWGTARCPCGAFHAACQGCNYTGRGAMSYDPVRKVRIKGCLKKMQK